MDEQSGSVGIRRNLSVRLGATLKPQIFTLELRSGQPLDVAGGEFITAIYQREADTVPIEGINFAVTALSPPNFRVDLSKEEVARLEALPLPPPATQSVPPSTAVIVQTKMRRFWWTCMFRASDGTTHALRYGSLDILLGASGA